MDVIGSTIPFLHFVTLKKEYTLTYAVEMYAVSLLIATKLLSLPRDTLKCLQLQLSVICSAKYVK